MREIKFRAWDIDGERWLEEDQFYIYPNGTVNAWIEGDEVENVKLVQFTELKDKNGKEIYEGDIVKAARYNSFQSQSAQRDIWDEFIGTVTWNHDNACWTLYDGSGSLDEELIIYEVIGNVFESPNLLKDNS